MEGNKNLETQQEQNGFDYGKLEGIIESRTEKVMQGIFKSFADENNLKLEELKEQYSKFQAGRKVEDVKDSDAYKALEQQYQDLQNTVKAEKTAAEIAKIATEKGLSKEQSDYVRKNLTDVYKEDGSLNTEKINEEIDKVSQLFNVQLKGNVGLKGTDDNNKKNKSNLTDDEQQIRKMFGL